MKKDSQYKSRKVKRRIRKKRRNRKLLFLIFVPLLLLITATSVYAFNLINKAQNTVDESYEDDGREHSELREYNVDPGVDHVSVLFIGVDESEHRVNSGDSFRSDALILATLNKDENSVKLLSIPRDSLVYIPKVGYNDKITHAHALGGPLATIGAVEHTFDVPVDYWVRLNFNAFVDVIDALGGIEFDVPYEFTESNSDDKRDAIHLYPGVQQIDGEEALAIVRTRKLDNDIERGKRQQQVMEAILNKAVSLGSINKLDNVIEAVGDNMKTNLLFNDMMAFISYGISGKLELEMLNLEGTDLWTDYYYYQLDEESLAKTKQILQHHLGLIDESELTFDLNEDESTTTDGSTTTDETPGVTETPETTESPEINGTTENNWE
ncbi:LCP family protein [Amphibacillus sp. MSJ-3]|uniref:LCP family protein n=1 Tax=Amphibacillus sp. MSJ-3 TaxID=2841505 RepID=UPI001C0EF73C|nr:LCP family protein [Amphibacillus sp. MSJ-3]MBU5594382.1 LCP family protein [Amphibacillus sp. MSJ-3]